MNNPTHRRWRSRALTVTGLTVITGLAFAIPALAHPTFSNNGPGFPNPTGGNGGPGQTPPYTPGSRPTLNMFLPFEQQGVIFNGAENTTVDVSVTLPVDFTNPACGNASTTTGNEQVGTTVPGWNCTIQTVSGHQVLHWNGPQISPTQTDADSAQYFTFLATMPSPAMTTSYGALGGPEGIHVQQIYADSTTERWIPPNDPGAASDPGHVANGIVRTVAGTATPTPTPTPVVTPTPTPPGAVTTTVTLSVIRIPLPFHLGGFVIPIATVTPPTADGTVQFFDGSTAVSDALPVSGGVVIGPFGDLPDGPHFITAVFTPTDSTAFQPSVSNTVTFTF